MKYDKKLAEIGCFRAKWVRRRSRAVQLVPRSSKGHLFARKISHRWWQRYCWFGQLQRIRCPWPLVGFHKLAAAFSVMIFGIFPSLWSFKAFGTASIHYIREWPVAFSSSVTDQLSSYSGANISISTRDGSESSRWDASPQVTSFSLQTWHASFIAEFASIIYSVSQFITLGLSPSCLDVIHKLRFLPPRNLYSSKASTTR